MLVTTIAALQGLNPSTVSEEVAVEGYTGILDGGGGMFYWSTATPVPAANGGTIIASTVSGFTTNGRWYRIFSGSLDVRWFGATGNGVTDDTAAFQNAIGVASSLEAVLLAPDTGAAYHTSGPLVLNNFVHIKSNGAVFTSTQSTPLQSYFILDASVSAGTDIQIEGINTTGLGSKHIYFIIGDLVPPPPPQPPPPPKVYKRIKRIALRDITCEYQLIQIDFNCTFIEMSGIEIGLGLTVADQDKKSSSINVSHDITFTEGEVLYMDNCYVWGNADKDMYTIKGGSFTDIRMTNLTANRLAFIPSATGDGFDMDGLGNNVVLDNIRSINCGIEIKPGVAAVYGDGSKNLTANNITALSGGITIRASGNYSNIMSIDPPGSALVISDGEAANDDRFINITNVILVKGNMSENVSAFLTIGKDNVNLSNVSITRDPLSTSTEISQAVRFSFCENVTINGINIKYANIAFTFLASSPAVPNVKNLVINACTLTNISNAVLAFGTAGFFNNLTFNEFEFNPGSTPLPPPVNPITYGAGNTFKYIKFNNYDVALVQPLLSKSSFSAISENFLFNNLMYDKAIAAGATPAVIAEFPIGHFALNVADGNLYYRKNAAAYIKLSNLVTNTFTVSGAGQTSVNIPHGLGAIPVFTNVNAKSADARSVAIVSWTEDATNIMVTFAAALPAGTNNIVIAWEARL